MKKLTITVIDKDQPISIGGTNNFRYPENGVLPSKQLEWVYDLLQKNYDEVNVTTVSVFISESLYRYFNKAGYQVTFSDGVESWDALSPDAMKFWKIFADAMLKMNQIGVQKND